jgi:hypothetical protein
MVLKLFTPRLRSRLRCLFHHGLWWRVPSTLPSVVRREFEDLVRKISGGGIGDENGVLNGVGGVGGGQGSITAQEYERVIEELMLERMKREELEQRLYDQRNPHREAYNQDNDDVEDDGLNYPL